MKVTEKQKQVGITIFLLFLFGCVVGWIYEILFYRIDTGHFIKRGQGFGPWLPIYGFGTLAIMAFMYKRKQSPAAVFFGSALTTGILEFITGWALFHFGGGLRLWDYNTEIWNWGNIGGYVCFRSVLIFGLAGLFLVYFAMPLCFQITSKMKTSYLMAITIPLAIVFAMDLIIGYIVRPLLVIITMLSHISS